MNNEPEPVPVPACLATSDANSCRACEAYCDRVVYPAGCIERDCPNLYAYDDREGRRFVGCLQRVFRSEIALDVLVGPGRRQAFGALRVSGSPTAICQVGVEQAYEGRFDLLACLNPEFFEPVEEPFRVELRAGA
jgi:hypothetical protein